jgi:Ser/Thr protein kinase RdoA (MazF antagonist)
MSPSSLRIARSIIAPESLVSQLENHYPLNISAVRLLSVGDNDHYLVIANDDRRYVLRVYRHNKHWLPTKAHHLFEINLLQFLYRNDIPVSYPIIRNDRHYLGTFQTPEGPRHWALFNFILGKEMPFTYKHCYNYGQIIAKMHHLTDQFPPQDCSITIDTTFLLQIPFEKIKEQAPYISANDLAYLTDLVPFLSEKIHHFHQHQFASEWGVIGGDFHGGNHFVDSKGGITLFDFDLSGYGWRTYDIAVFKWALYDICRRAPKVRNRASLWNGFLEGYHRHRSLNSEQLSIILAFIQARQIWLMGSETTYPDKILNASYWKKMFEGLKSVVSFLK